MICPNCGTTLPDTSKFCASCGKKLTPGDEASSAPPESAPAPAVTAEQAEPQITETGAAEPAFTTSAPEPISAPEASLSGTSGLSGQGSGGAATGFYSPPAPPEQKEEEVEFATVSAPSTSFSGGFQRADQSSSPSSAPSQFGQSASFGQAPAQGTQVSSTEASAPEADGAPQPYTPTQPVGQSFGQQPYQPQQSAGPQSFGGGQQQQGGYQTPQQPFGQPPAGQQPPYTPYAAPAAPKKSKTPIFIIAGVAVVALILVCLFLFTDIFGGGGGGQSSYTDVVKVYFEIFEKNDLKKMREMFMPEVVTAFTTAKYSDSDMLEEVDSWFDYYGSEVDDYEIDTETSIDVDDYEVLGSEISTSRITDVKTITVLVTLDDGDGSFDMVFDFDVVKIENKWYLVEVW